VDFIPVVGEVLLAYQVGHGSCALRRRKGV